MMDVSLEGWLLIFGAYLLGAIPFGLILAKRVAGVDVRAKGSGNIGATNVARTAGKKLGILTLLLDALKGALPVLAAEHAFAQPLEVVCATGLAAILGHVFPVYLLFRGGKGVATSAGVFLAITPIASLVAAGVFLAVYAVRRIVSIGSLLASVALIIAVVFLDGRQDVLYLAGAVVVLIVVRHKSNIQRLINRAES